MGQVNLTRQILIVFAVFAAGWTSSAGQASFRVSDSDLQSPRPLGDQTKNAVIRDYLQSWQVMTNALEQNRPDLVDESFVGSAKADIATTIQQQSAFGIHTRYRDLSHKIQLLLYSPEGLSIELADDVDYDVQVLDHGKLGAAQRVHMRYIAVLSPGERRWLVRVFQAEVG